MTPPGRGGKPRLRGFVYMRDDQASESAAGTSVVFGLGHPALSGVSFTTAYQLCSIDVSYA